MNPIDSLRETTNKRIEEQAKQSRHQEQLDSSASLQRLLFDSFHSLTQAVQGQGSKAEVIGLIVTTLDKLEKAVDTNKNDVHLIQSGLKTLEGQLKDIPTGDLKQLPKFLEQRDTVKVSNLETLEKAVKSLESAVKAQKLSVKAPDVKVDAPVVNVDAPQVTVPEIDMTPITGVVADVRDAIKTMKAPAVQKTEQQNTLIHEKFDEYKIKYDRGLDDDDEAKIVGITYWLGKKKVAELKYSYDKDGNLLGGRRV